MSFSTILDIINCKHSVQYQQDCHAGRCLFNQEYFCSSESKLAMGCIVKILLCSQNDIELGVVLCTAWPDFSSPSQNSNIPLHSAILDDTVIVSGNISDLLWTDCKGKVSALKACKPAFACYYYYYYIYCFNSKYSNTSTHHSYH
jgi:hypothetical protein